MEDINKLITKRLRAEDEERSKNHVSSGKLSASQLGYPIQWQVLKYLSQRKGVDNYTLAKFRRGRDVEDFIIDSIRWNKIKLQDQVECLYRNVIGYLDIYTPDKEVIEVKSITNMDFKWVIKRNKAKHGHILQACLYALALKQNDFSVLYVASDDYRTKLFTFKTVTYKKEVDQIISKFDLTIKARVIPEFEAIEKWNTNKKYNSFIDWVDLKKDQLAKRASKLYKLKDERDKK